MKQLVVLLSLLCLCGCGQFRYAASEAQKKNAWLHERVCAMAADKVADENTSPTLSDLTTLAHKQSGAFVVDTGLPRQMPAVGDVEMLLSDGAAVARAAKTDAAQRPDMWTMADSAMQLGIALAGLVGGVYGVRAAGYFKTAREKSKALKEIIEGNELFRHLYPEQKNRFKQAHEKQSPKTQQWVAKVKAASL